MLGASGIESHDAVRGIDDLQAAADMDRRGGDDLPALNDGELGGAAADVDVEDAQTAVVRNLRRARAVRSEHRLHVVACGCAHQVATLPRDDVGDRGGVLAPQRFAGEDRYAGIDVGRRELGFVVGGIDDRAERAAVDARCAGVRGKRDRRLV